MKFGIDDLTAILAGCLVGLFFVMWLAFPWHLYSAEVQAPPTEEQLIEARGRLLERRESRISAANTEVLAIDAQLKQVEEELAKRKGTDAKAKTK